MMRGSFPAFLTKLLPPLQPCDRLLLEEGDIVVHAPGFEDRTMAIADSVTSTGGAQAVLLDYRPFNAKNRLRKVRSALLAKGVQITREDVIEYNRFEPGNFEGKLELRLKAGGARRVLVDISSMSKLAIMLVLNVCRKLKVEVCILYTEAQTYGPSEQEFESAKENREIHRPTLQIFTGFHGVLRCEC